MRLLAALLLVSCGSADADFGGPPEPDDGGAGGQAAATAGGGRTAAGGASPGAGGHACAPLRPNDPDICLEPCRTDADCSNGWLCVEANAPDPTTPGALVTVCRAPCTCHQDCDVDGKNERCVGFEGQACTAGCGPTTRYACGIRDVVCAVQISCSAGDCQ